MSQTKLNSSQLNYDQNIPGNKLDLSSAPIATETTNGVVQKATDAEVIAGTENTNFVTPKQVKDNYFVGVTTKGLSAIMDVNAGNSLRNLPKTTTTPTKMKEVVAGFTGNCTTEFELSMGGYQANGGCILNARIYVNGSAVGTAISVATTVTDGIVIGTDNFNVAIGDLIQVYGWYNNTVAVSDFLSIRNFKVGYSPKVKQKSTVNL